MAEITAALVKELREKTGAGMMDCKKALTETGGDVEQAKDWLRKKGLAAAAKKAGRVTAEGLVAVKVSDNVGAVVEVNSETDFVARNEVFQEFVAEVAGIALEKRGDLEAVRAADYPGTGRNVAEELAHRIASIGENLTLRRAAGLEVDQGIVASYVHNAVAPGLGKIGVLVGLESPVDAEKLAPLGKQLAMHVAAARPEAATVEDIDPDAIARERAILTEQAKASGKPDEIVEKMVEGRLRKYYQEVVLLEQTYVIDGESRVAKVLEDAARELGGPVRISGFVRFEIGEGVEKEEKDFAAEVAEQLAG